ncbi:hypothetical protein O6P43_013323 [Quillaja saponaria]|uniref:Uncharacterized protein n=1 Tax=Quillaja saponaria TaxID=32244 RepID=A0AAD7M445_QUISA|nr:hypothetical protein O6P43_013323 [Quillaja saponaria]
MDNVFEVLAARVMVPHSFTMQVSVMVEDKITAWNFLQVAATSIASRSTVRSTSLRRWASSSSNSQNS